MFEQDSPTLVDLGCLVCNEKIYYIDKSVVNAFSLLTAGSRNSTIRINVLMFLRSFFFYFALLNEYQITI